jgi:shikimate dehydrogenase
MSGQPDMPIAVLEALARSQKGAFVLDMVYSPLRTRLLERADAVGARTIDGLHMLIGQAAHAFELFFGAGAPRRHDAELRELLTR